MASVLQRERVRGFLIEAAKRIVLEDGVSKITVRMIGDQAGFSYATLYNYFRDLDQLLWHVSMSFIQDLVDELSGYLDHPPLRHGRVKELYHAYVRFFLDRPTVFELLFCTRLGEAPEEFAQESGEPKLARFVLANLEGGGRSGPEADSLAGVLTAFIHGLLLMEFAGKAEGGPEALLAKLDSGLELLLAPVRP